MKPDCMFKLQHLQEVTFRAITADQGFTSGYGPSLVVVVHVCNRIV